MTTNKTATTMTIIKGYTLTPKTDKNDNVVYTSVVLSDSASVDTPDYNVEFKTADYRIPDSNYLLDSDKFAQNVNASATAIVYNEIVNVRDKMTAQIADALDNDSVDVMTVADKIAQRDALNRFLNGKRKTTSSDTIATAFAFAIIQPKYTKYTDSDALIDSIRDAYNGKTDSAVKSIRDSVTAFALKYICVTDETKSVVYKNVKARLSLDDTSKLIDVVSSSPLVYTRKGITDKRMTVNKAVAQLMLFVLRETFNLSVSTVKTDTTSYLLIG